MNMLASPIYSYIIIYIASKNSCYKKTNLGGPLEFVIMRLHCICSLGSHKMKDSAYLLPVLLTLHSIFLVHLTELCKLLYWPLFLGYNKLLVDPWICIEMPSLYTMG